MQLSIAGAQSPSGTLVEIRATGGNPSEERPMRHFEVHGTLILSWLNLTKGRVCNLVVSPACSGGSIWMSGAGAVVDATFIHIRGVFNTNKFVIMFRYINVHSIIKSIIFVDGSLF